MEKESLRILVIDPDPDDHFLIRGSLERSAIPADLKIVTSTDQGLKDLPGCYDLILTDHAPPEVSALKLLQGLKQKKIDIPVILLTDNGQIQTVRETFRWGASDYLLKEELEAISLFDVFSTALEKRRSVRESEEQSERLRAQAACDGLTGLYNHRYFLEVLEREFWRAKRYWRPLCLLMIDLDGFKSINDTLGHQEGDRLLVRIAALLKNSVRNVDLVARYGGDEFAILLPETSLRASLKIGQRILEEIRQNPHMKGGRIFPLSASVGLAVLHPQLLKPGELIREADQALYSAKRSGRNRLVSWLHPDDSPSEGVSDTPLALTKQAL